ncbi:Gfo/Idh/MocA family oxidoreductase [Chryseolinea sp. T2]|uniref:Gfo/Idh/MocA family protein n=1 Tax=Chryseolinea sp. T2 TaxID=3129255 RepID=UPI0030777C1B
MRKVALVGAGKMGISHLSILGAHPKVDIVGVCDSSKIVVDVLKRYSKFPCFTDYDEMLDKANPDAVVVAVPTKYHSALVKKAVTQKRHVFAEKPLSLSSIEGLELVKLVEEKKIVNQVGYHNKFIGTFRQLKRLIGSGYLGDLFHFQGEAYGPVVTRPKNSNWRGDPKEGGGCLMDYASHVIDLLNDVVGPIKKVKGSILKSCYSNDVEDAVYALVATEDDLSGVISVNWSDESYRKMSTSITIVGSEGKAVCDATQIKVYFKTNDVPKGYSKGWNIKYVTDFTDNVDFYLRGEEYSAQLDYFVEAMSGNVANSVNTFRSAWETDHVITLIKQNSN